ncbi:MAG: hypothetical protein J6S96_05535 [Muribaculaceae bacterium]|nr:hypothetical protein [Muribaculaceae bacterium]
MELSNQKKTEAKKLNVTTQYLVMADLCAIGYSEADAYAKISKYNQKTSSEIFWRRG